MNLNGTYGAEVFCIHTDHRGWFFIVVDTPYGLEKIVVRNKLDLELLIKEIDSCNIIPFDVFLDDDSLLKIFSYKNLLLIEQIALGCLVGKPSYYKDCQTCSLKFRCLTDELLFKKVSYRYETIRTRI